MKAMNDGDNDNTNWLGFSLSPHMNMDVSSVPHQHQHQHHYHHHHSHQQQQTQAAAAAAAGFLAAPQLETQGGALYSQLAVMPLKSDGSLCIMEALSRSQQGEGQLLFLFLPSSRPSFYKQSCLCYFLVLLFSLMEGMVPSSSPKLEDFLGGATMGAHQYGSSDREAMSLSLDSMYYQQPSPAENSRHQHHSLGLLHPYRQLIQSQQHHPYFQPLQEGMCSALAAHDLYQAPMEMVSKEAQMPLMADGISGLKNWVARHYSAGHAMGEKMGECVDGEGGGGAGSVAGAMGYGDLQSLSLSMSPGSQSSCITAAAQQQLSHGEAEHVVMDSKKRVGGKVGHKQPVHRKSIDTFGQRTSQYRGVTRSMAALFLYFSFTLVASFFPICFLVVFAHLWDNSCKKEGQSRKGRQGGYDMEEKAARAYDLAALKYWGPSTHINFPLENYQGELEEMKNMSRQEYVAHLRRKSSGFSRGASMYRGVTRHHQHGRWQARIGRVAGNKDLYLGTFISGSGSDENEWISTGTQEEAAEAYDIAAIKFRGVNAVTNFDISRYDVERIMASNTLLAGEFAKRNKDMEAPNSSIDQHPLSAPTSGGDAELAHESNSSCSGWKMVLHDSSPQQQTTADHLDQKPNTIVNYQNPAFSSSLNDLIGIDTISMADGIDESGKMGSTRLSNSSSLVTSLNSSREGSPDKVGHSMLLARPASSKFNSPAPMSSWIQTNQLRPAMAMAHMPVFAAWNDA
ncbi:hypothetical protein ACLOJK_003377 [Asimina triloba]